MKTSQITEITIVDNTDIEFVANGRLYVLLIGQEELDNTFGFEGVNWESPLTGQSFTDEEPVMPLWHWQKMTLTEPDILEVIQANQVSWEDVTECTDKGQAMLRKQARRNLLSWIVSGANKLRATLKSMSLAMHTAWTKAKILITGFVQFVKVSDVDSEGEIPVFSRRVASLESQGFIPKGEGKTTGTLKFIDLDKKDLGLPLSACIISMHVWQVVGWSSFVVKS